MRVMEISPLAPDSRRAVDVARQPALPIRHRVAGATDEARSRLRASADERRSTPSLRVDGTRTHVTSRECRAHPVEMNEPVERTR